MVFSGERMVPDRVDHGNLIYHLRRYEFAGRFVQGKRVLDVGCGIGYGSEMLAAEARSVVAVDYCADAVLYAREHHGRPNLRFGVANATSLCFQASSFDVVVSMEVFEHLADQEAYLAEVWRVLRPGGLFVMSTPNQAVDRIHMESVGLEYEYHINMAAVDGLKRLLERRYRRVRVYGLRRKGSPLYAALRALDVFNLRLRLFSPSRRQRLNAALGTPDMASVAVSDVVVSRWQVRQANWVVATGEKPAP